MLKIYYVTLLLSLGALLQAGDEAFAQQCDPSVPVFNVNLSGYPGGSYISPPVHRNGLCCSASGPDNCVEFDITLDSAANGIRFSIASGAVPGGSLYYQIDCGPPATVGSFICLNGPGPHHLTFCKPGGNTNTFEVQSIPKPSLNGTQWISQACSGLLVSQGLVTSSVTWTSVPSNAIYNSYLSCTSGCDSAAVVFNGGAMPSSVLYQVCGNVIGGCNPIIFCDTIRVNFVNDLAVNITPKNPVICYGNFFATVTAQPLGGKSPYSYIWSNGATSQSVNVGAGTYVVQIKDAMNCSTAYDTVIVSALASNISASAGPDQVLCLGTQQSVSLNGTITTATGGIWTGGSGSFNPSDTVLNTIYTPSASEIIAGVAQLMLVTTGNYGCSADTDKIQINIAPQPVPQVIGTFAVCEYSTGIYAASNPTPVSYQWTVTGGTLLTPNNGSSVTVQWNSAGAGSITLNASNTLCDSVITYPVTINPQPTPAINGPSSVCVPASTIFSLANPSGNNYQWTVTGGTITGSATGSSISVQWNNTGTGNVSVKESNSYGCDSTVSVNVILNPQPVPQVAGSFNVCERTVATYVASCNVQASYLWTVTGGTSLSPNGSSSMTVQWNNAGAGSIAFTATHAAGCDSTIVNQVTINPKPSPVISGPSTICVPQNSTFSVTVPTGNTYNWSVIGGTILGSSTGNNILVQWNSLGSAYVSVTETNSYGCDTSVTFPVTLNSYPTPFMSGKQMVCQQDTATYWVPYVQNHTYNWKVIGGSIIGFTVTNSVEVYWYGTGTGQVSVEESTPAGCDSTISQMVRINPLPSLAIAGPLTVCENQCAVYTSPNNNLSYNWNTVGGYIMSNSSQTSVNIQWNNAGNGMVMVMASDSNGCMNNANVQVLVRARPLPIITGSKSGCVSQQMNSYSATTSSGGNLSYTWTTTGGFITNGNGTNKISILWTTPGTFTITARAINLSTGCDSTSSIQVTVDTLQKPVVSANNYNGCSPLGVNFNGNVTNPNYSYKWTFGDGQNSMSSNPSHQYNNVGTFPVTLIVANNSGCVDTAKSQVQVFPNPVANFQSSLSTSTYYNTTPFTLQNLSAGATQYYWDFGNGDNASGFEPKYQYPAPGHYTITLIVTNNYGCRDTILSPIEIKVPEDIYIPNAFSPNSDSRNDMFHLSCKNISDLKITIFDRWGQEVFSSSDKDFAWDGTFKGSFVQGGVYVYEVKATGEYGMAFDKLGTVTVVR